MFNMPTAADREAVTDSDRERAKVIIVVVLRLNATPFLIDVIAKELAAHRERTESTMYPIFDILPRLWASGHLTFEKDGEWILLDGFREVVLTGKTFRELCVNIVLGGF